jgi:hypothetical protein
VSWYVGDTSANVITWKVIKKPKIVRKELI